MHDNEYSHHFYKVKCLKCNSIQIANLTRMKDGLNERCPDCPNKEKRTENEVVKNRKYDYTGQIINNRELIEYKYTDKSNKQFYLTKCTLCNDEEISNINNLRNAKKNNCKGCFELEHYSHIGEVYGRLTIVEYVEYDKKYGRIYKCECECGNFTTVKLYYLKNGSSTSCGCYARENAGKNFETHGLSNTKIYSVYKSMKQRCYDKNHTNYDLYGGRGINICKEWLDDFRNFYYWSLNNGYSEELSIDRINVNGNYEPNNCRWVTMEVQANNKTTNRYVELYGEILTIKQVADRYNINYGTLISYINYHPNLSIYHVLLHYNVIKLYNPFINVICNNIPVQEKKLFNPLIPIQD